MGDKKKIDPAWKEENVISQTVNEQERFVNNVIDLLDVGATIPFIARYRKEKTGDMPVNKLREISAQLDDLRQVRTKMSSVYGSIKGLGKMTKQLELTLQHARTMEEVDMLYAPFKPGHKGSLAERAKAAGLEPAAMGILDGKPGDLRMFIKAGDKGVSTMAEVKTGIQHIIADIIAKDKEVMEEIRKICATSYVSLQSKRSKTCSAKGEKEGAKGKGKKDICGKQAAVNSFKFEQYFDFQCPVSNIKPHQILAINRGEEHKVLTVKVNMPNAVKCRFTQFVHRKFVSHFFPQDCRYIIEKSIEDSFDRLVQPQMSRHIRSEHTKSAEKASIEVFAVCGSFSVIFSLDRSEHTKSAEKASIEVFAVCGSFSVIFSLDRSEHTKSAEKASIEVFAVGAYQECRESVHRGVCRMWIIVSDFFYLDRSEHTKSAEKASKEVFAVCGSFSVMFSLDRSEHTKSAEKASIEVFAVCGTFSVIFSLDRSEHTKSAEKVSIEVFAVCGSLSEHTKCAEKASIEVFAVCGSFSVIFSLDRSEHTKSAEKASIEVFGSNLHSLLLTPPIKGKTVLGVDPGFKNGCKTAVVSATGEVLHTEVLYLHDYKTNKVAEDQKLIGVIKTHRCDVIAIGNGVACRETEQRVSGLIQNTNFHPLSVVYCIVDEGGASIYSVSDEAQKELPKLDPTLRGAVSIARRLQDPLSELVKIEPKHIGVGMYQHDVSKTKLQTALDSVVEECVSFTGVDLNTASQCLLRRVAGMNVTKANKVIEWRSKNGRFTNRSQLLKVKGLGEKSYEQCAGFVRVVHDLASHLAESAEAEEAESTSGKAGQKRKAVSQAGGKAKKAKLAASDDVNLLDMTAIHPESYSVASKFLSGLALSVEDLGKPDFIAKVKRSSSDTGVNKLAERFEIGAPTMQLIVEALSRPVSYDFRSDFQKPLFKKGMTSVADLKPGSVLTGRVTNVTHFGAFVDIGVGDNGLIHVSKMRPPLAHDQNLSLGDHVEVMVMSVEAAKNRIGLQLKRLLNG
ncbi:hypothetical protein ACOMHN_019662 [Nucella lapillus]